MGAGRNCAKTGNGTTRTTGGQAYALGNKPDVSPGLRANPDVVSVCGTTVAPAPLALAPAAVASTGRVQ